METGALPWMIAALALLGRARHRSKRNQKRYVELLKANLTHCHVRFGSQTIRFQLTLPPETIEPLFSGAAWAGTVVWPAAVFLGNYLGETGLCRDKVVIELGAGVGIPGITASFLGARKVYLTEQPPLSDLLSVNTNQLRNDRVRVFTFDWFEPPAEVVEECQVVLISDCIYEGLYGESWKALASVLNVLLTDDSDSLALNSVERRKEDGIDRFITHCQEQYGIYSELKREVKTMERHIQLYELRRKRRPV